MPVGHAVLETVTGHPKGTTRMNQNKHAGGGDDEWNEEQGEREK